MEKNEFKRQLWENLEKLPQEQVAFFAWRCAVLAVPIIALNKDFNFWSDAKRKKYLYTLFNDLDITVYVTATKHSPIDTGVSTNVAKSNTPEEVYIVNTLTFDVLKAVTCAYVTATDVIVPNEELTGTIIGAKDTALYTANIVASVLKIDIHHILLRLAKPNNLDSLKAEILPEVLYGKIWQKFQILLSAEGCSYWGKLYQKIFDDGLTIDLESLQKRLNVPQEIKEFGAAEVAAYLEKIETEGGQRLNEARIIILGEKGAGKTCLARRLINPTAPMTKEEESTAGVDTLFWKLEKENLNVRIWDFAGHVVTHAVHQFFLSERCVYIIVYNSRTEDSNRLDYWLDHMKNYGGNSKAFILINRRDAHTVDIQENNLREKYAIEGVYDLSIRDDNEKLALFRNVVANYIVKNPSWSNQEIPTSYFNVKNALEELFEKGNEKRSENFICREQFDNIAEKFNIENKEELLTNLHLLGVGLWYKDMEHFDTLVLNPEWISRGVYKIINWAADQKSFSLSLADFHKIFSSENDKIQYTENKHRFLFNLMKKYELAFETDDNNSLVIPHLLKEDRPKELPDFIPDESLLARYRADSPLPPNAISRFIVRHHKGIVKQDTYLVWRYGVVLSNDDGGTALVRQYDRTISISVKGPGKRELLNDLRATLNDIFNGFKSKKPELQYRIEEEGSESDNPLHRILEPLWLPDSKILNHALAGKPYYDDRTGKDIPMQPVVINLNITTQNLITGSSNTLISGTGNAIDQSSTTFNFSDCNFELQGHLNELSKLFEKDGNGDDAVELKEAADALIAVEESIDKKEVKRSGALNCVRRIVEQLSDEKTLLNKSVKGVKNGISIAKEIVKAYNAIHGWMV